MKAARLYGIGDIRIEDISEDPIFGDSVKIRVTAAGICGSDIHNFKTGQWLASVPVTPGHEFCGTVIEVGCDVKGFAVGDQVVADSRSYCGHCPACLDQAFNHCEHLGFVGEVCNGGFAQFVTISQTSLLKVPIELAPSIAVLSEPLGVALRTVNQLAPNRGERIKVFGGGTIGGLTALLLQELYDCEIDLSEPNVDRKALLQNIMSLTSFDQYSFGVDATGIPSVINTLVQEIRPAGRIALVGLPHSNKEIDILSVVEKELHLIGCSVFQHEQMEVIELLEKLTPKLEKLISLPIPIEDIPSTYQRLRDKPAPYLKAIICP
ncbi:zinc-dependent alcohol dehydrogenase [Vibrio sp. MA40-2]|uniref:zinc-dependent alcohol dehydrogenase n=1 Tax=Vibrio sp. MA40-2 TaxID=3391828 RepID=UPI0039A6F19E